MKTFIEKPLHTLAAAAFAVAGAFGTAHANEQVASNQTNVALPSDEVQEDYPTLTAEEARQASAPAYDGGPGSVVLLVGEDFDYSIIDAIKYSFDKKNINFLIAEGGNVEKHLQVFINGDELKSNGQTVYLDESTTDNLLVAFILNLIDDNRLNVYAQNNDEEFSPIDPA